MTPTQADAVIAAIKARRPGQWPPEMWADFRAAMIRIRIDAEQGIAAAVNVILTSKFPPTPAHYLEAFVSAQGLPQPTTGSPRNDDEGYRGEFWHPRGWAIVRGWMWMRQEENWPKLPDMMQDFARENGWLPDWEEIIAPNPPGPFTNEQIQGIGLWVNARTRKANPRGSYDLWAAKQREDQERRVRIIGELRKKARVTA